MCVCIINCFMGYFKPVILYARNSPTWTNYSYGKNQNLKKKSRKKMLYTCSKITDLYGNLQCFVLAGQFEGGGNPIARLYILHILFNYTIRCTYSIHLHILHVYNFPSHIDMCLLYIILYVLVRTYHEYL